MNFTRYDITNDIVCLLIRCICLINYKIVNDNNQLHVSDRGSSNLIPSHSILRLRSVTEDVFLKRNKLLRSRSSYKKIQLNNFITSR